MNYKVNFYNINHTTISPIKIGDTFLNTRPTIICSINNSAIAELSPLAGLHNESLRESYKTLREFIEILYNYNPNWSNFLATKPLFNVYNNTELLERFEQLPPSTKFTIESIIFEIYPEKNNLLHQGRVISPAKLFICGTDNIKTLVKKNSCISGTVKIKVGRIEIDQEIDVINEIIDKTNLKIRIDCNYKLSFIDLKKMIEHITNLKRIEYFESPIKDQNKWVKLSNNFHLKSAIDEFLYQSNNLNKVYNSKLPDYISSIILKPNLFGSISSSFRLFEWARSNNLSVILSSCFEGPVGIKMIKNIYRWKGNISPPDPGIDTLKYFL